MKKILACLSLLSCFISTLAVAEARTQLNQPMCGGNILCVPSKDVVDPSSNSNQPTQIATEKPECGYHRPLRVAAGMIGNAPFAWEEYANAERTRFKSYGLGLHIIDDLSKKLGFTYETTGFATEQEAKRALKMGDIDVLFTTYYTNLGIGTRTIYPGYFINVFQAYVKKGSDAEQSLSSIKNFKDLIGWKGVVRQEEGIYPLFKQRTRELKLKEELGAPKVFKMLMEGEVDYLIGSPYAVEAELRRQKLTEDIVPVGGPLDQASLFFTFSTNSNCTKMPQDFIKVLKEDPMPDEKIEDLLFQMIDDWGNRFREEKGLLDKEQEEQK